MFTNLDIQRGRHIVPNHGDFIPYFLPWWIGVVPTKTAIFSSGKGRSTCLKQPEIAWYCPNEKTNKSERKRKHHHIFFVFFKTYCDHVEAHTQRIPSGSVAPRHGGPQPVGKAKAPNPQVITIHDS